MTGNTEPIDWRTHRWFLEPSKSGIWEAVLRPSHGRIDTIGGGAVHKAGVVADTGIEFVTRMGVSRRSVLAAIAAVVVVCFLAGGGFPYGVLIGSFLAAAIIYHGPTPVRLSFPTVRREEVGEVLRHINNHLNAGDPNGEILSRLVLGSNTHWSHAHIRDVLDVDRLVADFIPLGVTILARKDPAHGLGTPKNYAGAGHARSHKDQVTAMVETVAALLVDHGRPDDARIVTYTASHITGATAVVGIEFEQAVSTIIDTYTEADALPRSARVAGTVNATIDAAMRHVRYLHDVTVGAGEDRLETARRYAEQRWPDPKANPLDQIVNGDPAGDDGGKGAA